MNTKILMTSSSIILGATGVFTIFMPDVLLSVPGAEATKTGLVLLQLMGGLYFAFALMNWTAKDSAIGGVYARPISLANFSHFFIGALLLMKYTVNQFSLFALVVTVIYIVYAACFYWLVFHATGLKS